MIRRLGDGGIGGSGSYGIKKEELSFSNSALLTEVMAMSIYREWVSDVFNSAIYGTVFARNLVILLVIANRGSASFPVTFPDLKMAP